MGVPTDPRVARDGDRLIPGILMAPSNPTVTAPALPCPFDGDGTPLPGGAPVGTPINPLASCARPFRLPGPARRSTRGNLPSISLSVPFPFPFWAPVRPLPFLGSFPTPSLCLFVPTPALRLFVPSLPGVVSNVVYTCIYISKITSWYTAVPEGTRRHLKVPTCVLLFRVRSSRSQRFMVRVGARGSR